MAAQQRAAAKERKKQNQAKSAVVQKVGPLLFYGLGVQLQCAGCWHGHPHDQPGPNVCTDQAWSALCSIHALQWLRRVVVWNAVPVLLPSDVCALLCCCVLQITNSATVKKLMKSKKQRKLLRTADTN